MPIFPSIPFPLFLPLYVSFTIWLLSIAVVKFQIQAKFCTPLSWYCCCCCSFYFLFLLLSLLLLSLQTLSPSLLRLPPPLFFALVRSMRDKFECPVRWCLHLFRWWYFSDFRPITFCVCIFFLDERKRTFQNWQCFHLMVSFCCYCC